MAYRKKGTVNLIEEPISEDHKKDPIIEEPKENPITEELEKDLTTKGP